ncbi:hypothetical protein [Pararcticibacter amylolyticus]|uniref:Uncharacterized protein n=1 Tax=Pararcticibacter amylolyticus TaxID=2173175 RepID=A0A2U2PJ30_9SPHI|nr:hypothetical protein [Pararcticibacter amylolyticus]PWG81274.1 hypothetical protein DDR33_07825 [Pararcticibacter amylolyticus]
MFRRCLSFRYPGFFFGSTVQTVQAQQKEAALMIEREVKTPLKLTLAEMGTFPLALLILKDKDERENTCFTKDTLCS